MKELYTVGLLNFAGDRFKDESIHIYEYSVRRYGFLAYTPLILYMVCKANKDGYAADKDIKRGFYTFKQALNYAIDTYKLPIVYADTDSVRTKNCNTCKYLIGSDKCQLWHERKVHPFDYCNFYESEG